MPNASIFRPAGQGEFVLMGRVRKEVGTRLKATVPGAGALSTMHHNVVPSPSPGLARSAYPGKIGSPHEKPHRGFVWPD